MVIKNLKFSDMMKVSPEPLPHNITDIRISRSSDTLFWYEHLLKILPVPPIVIQSIWDDPALVAKYVLCPWGNFAIHYRLGIEDRPRRGFDPLASISPVGRAELVSTWDRHFFAYSLVFELLEDAILWKMKN